MGPCKSFLKADLKNRGKALRFMIYFRVIAAGCAGRNRRLWAGKDCAREVPAQWQMGEGHVASAE